MIKSTYLLFVLLTLMLFSSVLSIVPMNGEDYALTAIFRQGDDFIYRISWAFSRALLQYQTWNARLGELNAIFQLSFPSYIQILFSTLSFIGFVCFIALVFFSDGNNRKIKIMISIPVVVVFIPSFEVFFWKTVNMGYLQPILLSFPCLYFFNSKEKLNELLVGDFKFIVAVFSLFLLGLSFENVAPALVIYMILSMLLYNKLRVIKLYFLILAILAGWGLLMTAQSTSIRTEYYQQLFSADYSSVDYIFARVLDVLMVFIRTCGIAFVFFFISFVYLWRCNYDKRELFLPVILSILIVGGCVFSPYTEPRAFLIAWIIMLAFICNCFFIIFCKRVELFKFSFLLLSCFSFFIMLYSLNIYEDFSNKVSNRNAMILFKVASGCRKPIEISRIESTGGYRFINNREEWVMASMQHMKNYYGCEITSGK